VALIARDDLAAGLLVGLPQRAKILGVDLLRQSGRADQVAEQHRQLPPLGGTRDRRRRLDFACYRRAGGPGFGRRLRQGRNRLQQLLAMAERGDPELLQVVGGQRAQVIGVDVVRPERIKVALQPQFVQQGGDVHAGSRDHHQSPKSLSPQAGGGTTIAAAHPSNRPSSSSWRK
jgi:hypothetical protein